MIEERFGRKTLYKKFAVNLLKATGVGLAGVAFWIIAGIIIWVLDSVVGYFLRNYTEPVRGDE